MQTETKFFFKHDTEIRDGYNYTAQPKIALILVEIVCSLICMHQGAALTMWRIEIGFKCMFTLYFSFQINDSTYSGYRKPWCWAHILQDKTFKLCPHQKQSRLLHKLKNFNSSGKFARGVVTQANQWRAYWHVRLYQKIEGSIIMFVFMRVRVTRCKHLLHFWCAHTFRLCCTMSPPPWSVSHLVLLSSHDQRTMSVWAY